MSSAIIRLPRSIATVGKIDADEGRVRQSDGGRDEMDAVAAADLEVAAALDQRGWHSEHSRDGMEVPGVGLWECRGWVLDGVVGKRLGHEAYSRGR